MKIGILIRIAVFILIAVTLVSVITPTLDEQLYRKFICCTIDSDAKVYNINSQKVYLDGEATEQDLERFSRELESMVGYEYDYKIVLTTYDIATTYMYGEQIGDEWFIIATTDTFADIVYIHTDYIEQATIHELAHTIDLNHNFSSDYVLLEAYAEAEEYSYMAFSPYEFFAEAYMMYLKGTLEDQKLVNWFDDVVIPVVGE